MARSRLMSKSWLGLGMGLGLGLSPGLGLGMGLGLGIRLGLRLALKVGQNCWDQIPVCIAKTSTLRLSNVTLSPAAGAAPMADKKPQSKLGQAGLSSG